ncbi:MAG: glycosyltransferase family 2 protein [Myxococcota bacterium]
MSVEVAVVGPFYNAREHVAPWLRCMAAQTHGNFRIYLVDDASTDGTPDEVRRHAGNLPLELIALTENRGAGAARNHAIRRALHDGAQVILLLDSDCRVAPDWVDRHAAVHRARPDISVLGGGVQGQASSIIGRADGFASWFTSIPHFREGPVTRLHLCSTNMSIKAHVFRAHGLFFDETLHTGEDVVFCRAARQRGLLLYLQSDVVAQHLDRDDVEGARRHHYRWGLHSFTVSQGAQGGYYNFLTRVRRRRYVAALVPGIALAYTGLVLAAYTPRQPRVWKYAPWILYLKWWNALGVYHGFISPERCRRTPAPTPGTTRQS